MDNDRLATQLRQLERRVRPGGRDSITHPGRGHDDLATATCGALWVATRGAVGGGEVFAVQSSLFDGYGQAFADGSFR